MTPAALKILRDLAEQKRQRDLAALTRANAEAAATATQMNALAAQTTANIANTPAEDLAIISRWLGWADQEKHRLLSRHHVQKSRVETARSFAATSDAKTRVIKDMLEQAEQHELMETRRKAEQMGREPDR